MNLLKRFNTYQKERFPLVILVATTTAVVLSSNAVTLSSLSPVSFLAAFFAGLLYLFHIRVIDEIRDNQHDNTYHLSRPIPRGVISLKELKTLDAVGVGVFLVIAFLFGKLTLLIGVVALLYTYLAGKEFFLGEIIRAKFFIYNAVNLVQMVLLQFFVYSLFSNTWYKGNLVWIHLLFIFINAILLEVLRKIKIEPEESIGHDTYSWHIGFKRSLATFLAFAFISYATFLWILLKNSIAVIPISVSVLFVVPLLVSTISHSRKKTKKSENLLYLSTLIMYVGLNLIIYFTI